MPSLFAPRSYGGRRSMGTVTAGRGRTSRATRKYVQQAIVRALEKKDHWVTAVSQSVSSTPTFVALSNVIQATTQASDELRTGDEITPVKLRLRMQLSANSTATNTVARVMVVLAKSEFTPGSTAPDADDLLYDVSSGPKAVISAWDGDASQNFKVLYDKAFKLDYQQNTHNHLINLSISKKNLKKLQFNAGTAEARYHLYLMYVSNQAVNTPSLNYQAYLRFLDG